jgi:hypothetical protein
MLSIHVMMLVDAVVTDFAEVNNSIAGSVGIKLKMQLYDQEHD